MGNIPEFVQKLMRGEGGKGTNAKPKKELTEEERAQRDAKRAERKIQLEAKRALITDEEKALREAKRAERKLAREARPELTEEQKAQKAQLRAERKEKREAKPEMTAEQKEQRDKLRADRKLKLEAKRALITPEEKELQAKLKILRAQRKVQMKAAPQEQQVTVNEKM